MKVSLMVSSNKGSYFLAAEYEKKLAAYESSTFRKLGEYNTHYEFGGKRMCITENGKYLAAAAYGRYGITLYDTQSGEPIWVTKEVKKIQYIRFSEDDTLLYAVNDDNRLYTISAADGSTVSVEKSIKIISADSTPLLKYTSRKKLIWDNVSVSFTDKEPLRLYSGNNRIFCALQCGGIKCFSLDGNELWSAENKPEEHYIQLCYNKKYGFITALCFKYGGNRTDPIHFLDVFSDESGELIYTVKLNEKPTCIDFYTFTDNGESVVSGNGNVYILGKNGYTMKEKQFDI